ncbi:hypothetical protein JCM5350_001847 [Sporobolomyces pararoseus]
MARGRSSNASTKKVKSEDEESDFEPSKKTQKSKKPRPTKFLNKAAADTEEEEPQEVSDDDDLEVVAEADSQGFWEALEILDETATQYFIRWKGTDEKGKPWKPTWEPKSNANAKLIEAWKKEGRKKMKHKKEAEKLARKLQREEEKRAKEIAKQKKAKGKKIMKMKEDSPDPQPTFEEEEEAPGPVEESNSKTPPVTLPSKVNRKRVVPDSEPSSQAREEEPEQHQSKKPRPAKQVTFDLAPSSSPLSSAQSVSGEQAPAVAPEELEVEQEAVVQVDVAEEEPQQQEGEVAPVVSSGESSVSIIPDSQPAPAKAFAYSSPEPGSQSQSQSQSQFAARTAPISRSPSPQQIPRQIVAPSQSQSNSHSHPSLDSPGTNHSDLESDLSHREDDDVAIWNDPSQQDEDDREEEGEYEEAQREPSPPRHYSPVRATTASTSRPIGRVPIPQAQAFFPASTQPESSQFDPIEDPDSSPYRQPIQQQQRAFVQTGSPRRAPTGKTILELTLGPPEDEEEDEIENDAQPQFTAFELGQIANHALSYGSNSAVSSPRRSDNSIRPLSRTGSGSHLIKRQINRPIIAPISIQAESGVGVGVASVAVAVAQPVEPGEEEAGGEEDAEMEEEEEDSWSPGFNEDYLASDLLATQAPAADLELDDVIDYEGVIAGTKSSEINGSNGESQTEAVDAGEGGSNGGGYHHSSYPSQQPQPQQQQQTYSNPNYHSSGATHPVAGNGGGGGASSSSGGQQGGGAGGYPYPSHFQSSHQHQGHSVKREYEDDRDESAKRARMEHQQQQQYYHQQQQQQQQAQQYAQQQHHYQQSQGYYQNHAYSSSPSSSSQQAHSQQHYSPQSQQQYHTYNQQYQQLPPMQTSPPVQTYSRSPAQLPSLQRALSNEGYTRSQPVPTQASPSHAPPPVAAAPTVSVATASPPRPRSPPAPQQIQTSTATGHLTSPSISRVQNSEPLVKSNPANSNRSPSPLPQGANSARTSSPAPSLEGVNDLIELVRASSQIEGSDGTKEEIVRFLRNPRGYGEGPLSRADFWAFELRRQMLDVGERVDFIILYTRDGTFKLKRSPTTTIPVEFARSLNHAPDRVRGQTPAVDAVLTLSASSPAPSPLSVSAMTREQLEQEVTALRNQVSAASTELSTLRPLAEETLKLRTEVQTLTSSNKQLKNSRDSAQQDMAYIQEQYSIASTAASARAQEASIAEAEAARLQGLLSEGLKQKAAFYEAGVKRWKLEVERMKKEVEMVRVERRKMSELGIREKAGKWDEVVARRQNKLQRKEQRQAGGIDAEEDEDDLDSDEETVSKILLGERPKSKTPPVVPSIIKLVPDTTATASSQTTSSAPDSSGLIAGGGEEVGYRCEWRGETQIDSQAQPFSEPCGLLLPTKEALTEHAISHVSSQ